MRCLRCRGSRNILKKFTRSPCISLTVSTLLGGFAKNTLPPPKNGSTYVRCGGKTLTILRVSLFFAPYQASGEDVVPPLPVVWHFWTGAIMDCLTRLLFRTRPVDRALDGDLPVRDRKTITGHFQTPSPTLVVWTLIRYKKNTRLSRQH